MIESRPLRIIAPDVEVEQRIQDRAAQCFDYAGLVRAAAAQRALRARLSGAGFPSDRRAANHAAPPLPSLFARFVNADSEPKGDTAAEQDQTVLDQREALERRVCVAARATVDALFRTQGHFLELATSLATEAAMFCADRAVCDVGHWEVRMPLDGRIFPNTTLYMSLSPFRLSLRFDTQSMEVRQLLLHHSTILECEIDSLLRAWGAPRDVDLTAW